MADVIDQQQTSSDNINALRFQSNVNVKLATSFVPALIADRTKVIVKLKKTGSPSGNVWITLEADSSGDPSGSALATSGNQAAASVSTSETEYTFTFASPVQLIAGNTYWIVIQGDYTFSTSNYISISTYIGGDGYTNGHFETFNGSTWSPDATYPDMDFYFKEYYDNTTVITTGGSPMFFSKGLTLG